MVIGFMGAALVGAGICVLMAVTGHGKEPDPVEDDRVDWIRVERGESTATPELSPDFDPPIASMNPK
jgi:hypothetical protein